MKVAEPIKHGEVVIKIDEGDPNNIDIVVDVGKNDNKNEIQRDSSYHLQKDNDQSNINDDVSNDITTKNNVNNNGIDGGFDFAQSGQGKEDPPSTQ